MTSNRVKLRVAAVQLSPVLLDRDGTTDKVVDVIERCGRNQVQLAVFPETVIPSYPYFAMVTPPAAIGELMARLHDQAVDDAVDSIEGDTFAGLGAPLHRRRAGGLDADHARVGEE